MKLRFFTVELILKSRFYPSAPVFFTDENALTLVESISSAFKYTLPSSFKTSDNPSSIAREFPTVPNRF